MHVGAVWIMIIALIATAILVVALRPTGKKKTPAPKPDQEVAHSPEPRSTARIEGSPVAGNE